MAPRSSRDKKSPRPPPVDRDVFICFESTHDGGSAEAARAFVEAAGLRCWIATRDVAPGTEWAPGLQAGIETSSVFLLLLSRHTRNSRYVPMELNWAKKLGRPILVWRLDRTDPHAVPGLGMLLGTSQFLNPSEVDFGPDLRRLPDAIRSLVFAVPRLESDDRPGARPPTRAGRRRKVVATTRSRLRAIGIDVGSTNIRGCVVDLDEADRADPPGKLVERIAVPTSPARLLGQVKAMLDRIYEEHHFTRRPPVGIGIAAPGQVDLRSGTLKFGPGLALQDVPFRTSLSLDRPEVEIRVDNDARCATRCELRLGIGRRVDSFVCVFIGTGVGSGAVIRRAIHYGANFCAGEIGHAKISRDGVQCKCHQVGCLESFVNGPAIARLALQKAEAWARAGRSTLLAGLTEPVDPRDVTRAIMVDDSAAKEVVREVAEHIGVGLANYLNVLNPDAVVLGGGVMSALYQFMNQDIRDAIRRNALPEVANTPIEWSKHTDDGAAIGAALLFHPKEDWRF